MEGKKVHLVEMRDMLAPDANVRHRPLMLAEIDKYAIQTTQTNYPETVQLGDAFQVRDDNWRIPNETI